jgi:hypothetical protein
LFRDFNIENSRKREKKSLPFNLSFFPVVEENYNLWTFCELNFSSQTIPVENSREREKINGFQFFFFPVVE